SFVTNISISGGSVSGSCGSASGNSKPLVQTGSLNSTSPAPEGVFEMMMCVSNNGTIKVGACKAGTGQTMYFFARKG
ncbi:MAG: hypothetical protein ACO29Z_06605, partial [Crocinitomicaceae bacterium]